MEDTKFPLNYAGSFPARDSDPPGESSSKEKFPITIKGTSANLVIDGGGTSRIYGVMSERAPWGTDFAQAQARRRVTAR